jgi:hypothetical protein
MPDLPMINENIEIIERKLNQLRENFGTDNIKVFEKYYAEFTYPDQQALFSSLHYEMNQLLRFLFSKMRTNKHYNANESRKLSIIIQIIDSLKSNLTTPEFQFELEAPYEYLITKCKSFLMPTNGSPIPENLEEIELIDHRNIFHLSYSISSPSNPTKIYPLIYVAGGSYAHVHKFKDESYNQWVIVKRAKDDLTPNELIRFRNEYDDLRQFDSPFIIKAYHYDEQKNSYTMEFADATLDNYIKLMNDRLTMSERIRLITQLFRAFSYIHKEGFLHRDISYQNILVKKYKDNSLFLKVADFGLAKHPHIKLTRPGTDFKGSLNDSNLRVIGFENYEIRHEVFAIAFVICYILTGKKELSAIKDEIVFDFMKIATNPDINKRFSSIDNMAEEFQKLHLHLKKLSKRKL